MNGPLPEDSAERKTYPMHAVISGYFPAALAKVAHHSHLGNEKHNPGEPLHWARGKSDDHLDAAMRHMVEGDLTGAAWRILAALQLECEAAGAPVAPLARGARSGKGGAEGYEHMHEVAAALWSHVRRYSPQAPHAAPAHLVPGTDAFAAHLAPAYDAHPDVCAPRTDTGD